MNMITIDHLTKDYGREKGVFDLSFTVQKGEVFGFLGPNGAGKTTTLRHLMGFTKPDVGICRINGMDCQTESAEIQQDLGYLPGEIAFFDQMNGMQFIKFIGELRGLEDYSRAEELIHMFDLDPRGKIGKMSKGMKQKIGIVCAFMHEPEVLILDEPTSGLDPLMQNRFVELILEEKAKGKTILMSSHMFEEVERTCQRVGIIRSGHLVAVDDISTLKESKTKTFVVTLATPEDAVRFSRESLKILEVKDQQVTVSIKGDMTSFVRAMSGHPIINLDVVTQGLEEIFMNYYGGKFEK